jgi:hypothetical protein
MKDEDGDGDADMSDDDVIVNEDYEPELPDPSLVVQLRYQKKAAMDGKAAVGPPGDSAPEDKPSSSILVKGAVQSSDAAIAPPSEPRPTVRQENHRPSNELAGKATESSPGVPVKKPSITNFFKPVTTERSAGDNPAEHGLSNGSVEDSKQFTSTAGNMPTTSTPAASEPAFAPSVAPKQSS